MKAFTLVNPSVCRSLEWRSPSESSFFRALALLKLQTGLHYHIYAEFIHTSKILRGAAKTYLEKTTVFRKKVVDLWAIDGIFVLPWWIYSRCKALLDSMGCPHGYEFGAKPNLITWVAEIFLSVY
jgi:hypothetical protein